MTRIVDSETDRGGSADETARIREVPAEAQLRLRLRETAARVTGRLDRSHPPSRDELQAVAVDVLERHGLTDAHLGFAMVAVDNAFWHDAFAAVPFHRRLLLLPHCLHDVTACRGQYSPRGLHCRECGACVVGSLKARAEALGYQVIVAEGTPAVVQEVLDGHADAILGAACMESLEKAFKRVSELGIPHATVPLLTNGCAATTVEIDLMRRLIEEHRPRVGQGVASYVPLLQAAAALFDNASLGDLLGDAVRPEATGGGNAHDPMALTERVAVDWLRHGGKRFRPFVTLAGYAAFAHGPEVLDIASDVAARLPRPVRRVAMAIEALHKASLVHDDIEDDDAYRYGRQTLHRQHGVAQAINVGDYLIGLGYRLVAGERDALGAAVVADTLASLAEAHQKLCRGQGAELALREQRRRTATPRDLMAVYALKTSPAFQTAMLAGVYAADGAAVDHGLIASFCRTLGVAYQTTNDLKDWHADRHDKLLVGQDALAMRPTILEAFATEAGLPPAVGPVREPPKQHLARLRETYQSVGVFDRAGQLVDGCRQRALATAAEAKPAALGKLMEFVVRIVL